LHHKGFQFRLAENPFVCKAFSTMTNLADGTHDVVVVDASEDDDGIVHLELAVTSGARKGDVVRVAAHALARAPLDLLGLPATLHVKDGVPRVTF
jgi:hypothetical protein